MSGCVNPMMLWAIKAFLLGIMLIALLVIAVFELREIPRITRARLARVLMIRVIGPAVFGCFLHSAAPPHCPTESFGLCRIKPQTPESLITPRGAARRQTEDQSPVKPCAPSTPDLLPRSLPSRKNHP
jgi:hypothetical protein